MHYTKNAKTIVRRLSNVFIVVVFGSAGILVVGTVCSPLLQRRMPQIEFAAMASAIAETGFAFACCAKIAVDLFELRLYFKSFHEVPRTEKFRHAIGILLVIAFFLVVMSALFVLAERDWVLAFFPRR